MTNQVLKTKHLVNQTLLHSLIIASKKMLPSLLESKFLLWKVNFKMYFPYWQVMGKVSVEPCNVLVFDWQRSH